MTGLVTWIDADLPLQDDQSDPGDGPTIDCTSVRSDWNYTPQVDDHTADLERAAGYVTVYCALALPPADRSRRANLPVRLASSAYGHDSSEDFQEIRLLVTLEQPPATNSDGSCRDVERRAANSSAVQQLKHRLSVATGVPEDRMSYLSFTNGIRISVPTEKLPAVASVDGIERIRTLEYNLVSEGDNSTPPRIEPGGGAGPRDRRPPESRHPASWVDLGVDTSDDEDQTPVTGF